MGARPVAGEERGRSRQDPNELAAAIWVETLNKRILLGADLLVGPSECGWDAVLASFHPEPASLFKIPHHGSPGADHPEVWSGLLDAPSLSSPRSVAEEDLFPTAKTLSG